MGRAQPAAALTQIGQLPRKSAQRGALSAFPMAPEPKPGVVGAVLAEFLLLLGASAVFAWRRGRRTGVAAFLPPPVVDVAGTRWCKGDAAAADRRRQWLLFGSRLAACLWFVGVIAYTFATSRCTPAKLISFFTIWNALLQVVFWALAALASALALRGSAPSASLRLAVHLLFEVCAPVSLLVSILLWGVLAPHDVAQGKGYRDFNFSSYNVKRARGRSNRRPASAPPRPPRPEARGARPPSAQVHLVNTVLLWLELACNRMVLVPAHAVLVLLWTGLYVSFAWAEHFCAAAGDALHEWPYFFLDLTSWEATLWYGGVGVLGLLAFAFAAGATRLKARLQPKGLPPLRPPSSWGALAEGGSRSLLPVLPVY